VFRTIRAA